jgi:hypothetical protein
VTKAFPRARWLALAWLAVFVAAYARRYGWVVFLNLCDVAVILTCVGLWLGSPLLLSSQAVSSLLVDLAWDLDLVSTAATGRHLVGGTEYMWDAKYPLWLRLMSAFHLVWPPLLLWSLRQVGYDRRGFPLQAALAAVAVSASRLALGPDTNQNFAYRDPILGRAWGPAPVHVAVIVGALVVGLYWPTHALLRRLFPAPRSGDAASAAGGSSAPPA